MVGGSPLPWVPDLVGRELRNGNGVLVVGSAYAGFIRSFCKRANAMPLSEYRDASLESFQRAFLRRVVAGDSKYYGKIAGLFEPIMPASHIGLLDLCRVSFVRRGAGPDGQRGDEGGDGVTRDNCEAFQQYVETPQASSWTWRRITSCAPRVIIALGSIAEHGLLRLFVHHAFKVARSTALHDEWKPQNGKPGHWVSRYADTRYKLDSWMRDRAWWTASGEVHGQPRQFRIVPTYHPSAHQFGANRATNFLAEILQAAG